MLCIPSLRLMTLSLGHWLNSPRTISLILPGRVTTSKKGSAEKALSSILVTLSEMIIEVRPYEGVKASLAIVVT